jgi:hypothetical protein
MSTESRGSRRLFLKTSASAAAGVGGLVFPDVQARGADEHQELTYPGKTIGQWIAPLKDTDSGARSSAASELGEIGSAAAEV